MAGFLKTVTILDLSGNPGLTVGVERGSIYFNGHFYSRKLFNKALEQLDLEESIEREQASRKANISYLNSRFKESEEMPLHKFGFWSDASQEEAEKEVISSYSKLIVEDVVRVINGEPRTLRKGPNWPDELG